MGNCQYQFNRTTTRVSRVQWNIGDSRLLLQDGLLYTDQYEHHGTRSSQDILGLSFQEHGNFPKGHQQPGTTVCIEIYEGTMLTTWNREKSLNCLSFPN